MGKSVSFSQTSTNIQGLEVTPGFGDKVTLKVTPAGPGKTVHNRKNGNLPPGMLPFSSFRGFWVLLPHMSAFGVLFQEFWATVDIFEDVGFFSPLKCDPEKMIPVQNLYPFSTHFPPFFHFSTF